MNSDLRRGRRAPLLLVALATSVLAACSLCGDDNVHNYPAPNRDLTATTFVRSCGATTPYYSSVTLHSNSDKYDRTGDYVFTARDDHGITVTWIDAHHLSIDCRSCTEDQVLLRTTKRADIEISYPR